LRFRAVPPAVPEPSRRAGQVAREGLKRGKAEMEKGGYGAGVVLRWPCEKNLVLKNVKDR